jgi:hypothetical protein
MLCKHLQLNRDELSCLRQVYILAPIGIGTDHPFTISTGLKKLELISIYALLGLRRQEATAMGT